MTTKQSGTTPRAAQDLVCQLGMPEVAGGERYHLARARWMTEQGYRHLLRGGAPH
jgi:hypothetical protein